MKTNTGRSSHLIRISLIVIAGLILVNPQHTLADKSPIDCTGSGLSLNLYSDNAKVNIGDTISYTLDIFNGSGSGPIVCDATDIQASLTTPDGISHSISLTRTTLLNGQVDNYSNVVTYVAKASDVKSDGTLTATAKDTGTIHQNDTNSQGGGNQGLNVTIIPAPVIPPVPSPTVTPAPSPSISPTPSMPPPPSASPSATPAPSPTISPTPTPPSTSSGPSQTPASTPSPSPTISPTPTPPSGGGSSGPSQSPTITPAPSPSISPTPTMAPIVKVTPTPTPSSSSSGGGGGGGGSYSAAVISSSSSGGSSYIPMLAIVPRFPNTGFAPSEETSIWGAISFSEFVDLTNSFYKSL